MNSDRILRLELSGSATPTTFLSLPASSHPAGLVFDHAGNLFVACFDGNRVLSYDTSGNIRTGWAVGGSLALARPLGLAFDISGNLYCTSTSDLARSVIKVGPTGQNPVDLITGVAQARGVAVAETGEIYVFAPNLGSVSKFASTGAPIMANFITGAFLGGLTLSP